MASEFDANHPVISQQFVHPMSLTPQNNNNKQPKQQQQPNKQTNKQTTDNNNKIH